MARILILGGGVCGLAAGLMLARDDHQVTLLERDPAPVPDAPLAAWESWERSGVPQFRQAHGLQPRGRQVLDDELPDVAAALVEAGAVRENGLVHMPPAIADRAARPGDERFTALHVRRPLLEQVIARAADAEPGLTVRRGAGVAALLTTAGRVTGARTDDGEELTADLVVDAMGRGSRLSPLLGDHGIAVGAEVFEPSRFVYYTRYFRGPQPELRAPRLSAVGSFSIVTLSADNGVYSVTVFAAAGDRPLKRLRDPGAFTALVRACPRHAHWLDGEPITGVIPMGGVIDRLRDPAAAPGVVSIADAWACTNPTLGRGITLGLLHVALLRDVIREHGDGLAGPWRERTARELEPFYRACVASDRVRLAEMEAYRAGREPAPSAEPAAVLRAALFAAMRVDADAFRAGLDIIGCLAHEDEVLARPGLARRVMALRGGAAATAPPLARDELLRLVA
jgi:2-polyprenyl-6-methoxyphenol hydroxylase-like FAD-dependent oxidoreductase